MTMRAESRPQPTAGKARQSRGPSPIWSDAGERVGGQVVGAPAVVGELLVGLHGQQRAGQVDGAVKQRGREAEVVRAEARLTAPRPDTGAERDPGEPPPHAGGRDPVANRTDGKPPARTAAQDDLADVPAARRRVDPDPEQ